MRNTNNAKVTHFDPFRSVWISTEHSSIFLRKHAFFDMTHFLRTYMRSVTAMWRRIRNEKIETEEKKKLPLEMKLGIEIER